MRRFQHMIIAGLAGLLVACSSAPTQPIAFDSTAIQGGQNRIAIQVEAAPKSSTVFPGAGCLLCIGVAMAAHTDLTGHIETLEPDELSTLAERLANVLRAQGATVAVLETPVDVEKLPSNGNQGDDPRNTDKDFSSLANSLNADKLLVVKVHSLGVTRPYSSYFPAGDPRAFVTGTGYMVDLDRNAYIWYAPLNLSRASDGAWNEPPKFPGLTNAYYQVLAEMTDTMTRQLSQASKGAESAPMAEVSTEAVQ